MIVGAGQRHNGIDETSFLQAEKDWIGAEFRAKAAVAELVIRFAGSLFSIGIAELRLFFTAAFKNAKDVSRLRNFPAEQRIKSGEDAFRTSFLGRGWRKRFDGLRFAVAIITFAEMGIFCGIAAVVVERGAPEKAGVGHHAGRGSADFLCVAARGATGF